LTDREKRTIYNIFYIRNRLFVIAKKHNAKIEIVAKRLLSI